MSAHLPSAVIARLEPLLLPRRIQRMRAVLATRTDHVAFVFERMTDPHNLSAALRSLEAFSFQDAHWIAPGEKLGLSHLITRGTERWLSLHLHPDAQACVAALRGHGYAIYASQVPPAGAAGEGGAGEPDHGGAGVPLHALDLSRRTALLFGNEHAGVTPELLALADGSFHIATLG
ncbi:MAG TPA: RNA methyltransferase, partial [bacterium]|nr:RNA methyltransferase [bacterium]